MRCLIVSPLPTVPRTQGNAVGVFTKARLLQQLGHSVDLLVSAFEEISDHQWQHMSRDWDSVHVVPYRGDKAASLIGTYGLDDWYDDQVSVALGEICRRWHYDVALINYVWMSAAFEALDKDTFKVLDTHDVFGDRDRVLVASGLDATWYYTTPAEEARGLARADVVLAVQEAEAAVLRNRTDKPVATVGHIMRLCFLPSTRQAGQKLRVGYIGSANLTNRHSLSMFIRAVEKQPSLSASIVLTVGGPIAAFVPRLSWIRSIGTIDDIADFYANVDCVVNPDVGGSGVKVKTVEALAYGRAVVSTVHGTYGLRATSRYHRCETPDEVATWLSTLANDESELRRLELQGKSLILGYQAEQIKSFRQVFER